MTQPIDTSPAQPSEPAPRADGMPSSSDERHLRILLALRTAMPNTYFDDGEAHGQQHGISIDFMRDPVADIDAKLRALSFARLEYSEPAPATSNPNNCAACDHKRNPDGGWCYMFRFEPKEVCMRHTARNLSPELKTVLVEAIRDSAELVHGGVAGEAVDVPQPRGDWNSFFESPDVDVPLPEYAAAFKPRWSGDEGGYTADQMRAYAQAVLAAELMLWRSHADAMAHALEVFEAQGSDKTKALRDYMDFKNSYKKETT